MPRTVRPKRLRMALCAGFVLATLGFLYLPVLVVFPLAANSSPFLQFPPPGYSLEWFGEFFRDPQWMSALLLSLRVALGASILATTVGGIGAYYVARRQGRAAQLLEPFVVLPLVVPIIVLALGAYALAISLDLVGSVPVLVAIHAVLAIPYAYINIRVGLATIDPRLQLAAQSLGARPVVAVRRVILPLLVPSMLAAAAFSFVLSLDETVIALFLSADAAPTLPVKMFTSINFELNPVVPVAATIMLAVTAAVGILLWVVRTAGRRLMQSRTEAGA